MLGGRPGPGALVRVGGLPGAPRSDPRERDFGHQPGESGSGVGGWTLLSCLGTLWEGAGGSFPILTLIFLLWQRPSGEDLCPDDLQDVDDWDLTELNQDNWDSAESGDDVPSPALVGFVCFEPWLPIGTGSFAELAAQSAPRVSPIARS